MAMESLIATEIMSWLELEKGVHVFEEWLQACIEWIFHEVSSLMVEAVQVLK